jgi:predicted nucleic acid-binding protein
MDLDDAHQQEVLECGTRLLLRCADAFYAATASISQSKLITWDAELIERAGGVTPTDFLSRRV